MKPLKQKREKDLPEMDYSDMKIGVVSSQWHPDITRKLKSSCLTVLKEKLSDEQIFSVTVPGSFELPAGARVLLSKEDLDTVICLGCVIKGETDHNEYINQAIATGLTNLSISTGIPCIFGVVTADTEEQAVKRAGGGKGNKGEEAAYTALYMAGLKLRTLEYHKKIGFK